MRSNPVISAAMHTSHDPMRGCSLTSKRRPTTNRNTLKHAISLQSSAAGQVVPWLSYNGTTSFLIIT